MLTPSAKIELLCNALRDATTGMSELSLRPNVVIDATDMAALRAAMGNAAITYSTLDAVWRITEPYTNRVTVLEYAI